MCVPAGDLSQPPFVSSPWSGPQRTPIVFIPFTLGWTWWHGDQCPCLSCSEGPPVWPRVFTPVQVEGGWLGACPPLRQQGGSRPSLLSPEPLPVGALTSALCSWPQAEAEEPQDVVVYDQSTLDASVLAADSFLSILLSKLDGCFDSVAILTGERPGLVGCRTPSLVLSPLSAWLRGGRRVGASRSRGSRWIHPYSSL